MLTMRNLAVGNWLVINDDVMGGRSTGNSVPIAQGICFTGELSLENNGGFSATRRQVSDSPDWARGLRIVARGDGRHYQARVRPDQMFDGVSWRRIFATDGEWQLLELPFEEFEPVFRGRPVLGAGPIRPEAISQLGFLLADGQPGSFKLEIRRIEFIAGKQ